MSQDIQGLIESVREGMHSDTEITPRGVQTLVNLITPLNNEFLSNPTREYIDDRIRRSFPGDLARHAVSELTKAIHQKKNQGSAVIDYLLTEIIELSGNNAKDRLREYSPILNLDPDETPRITSYDIYVAIFGDPELKQILTIPQFPYRDRQRQGQVSTHLTRGFIQTYYEPDFLAGLDDYIDTFIRSVRRIPDDQIRAGLTQLGVPDVPTESNETRQNKYISAIMSRLNTTLQRYAQQHQGQMLDFTDLARALSSVSNPR